MYDQFAKRYAALVRDGALKSIVGPLAERLLGIAGEVEGKRVLDAGCGEGHLARALARRGARVLAIDASPRLIELARRADPDAGLGIEYAVVDLSQPLPRYRGTFALALGNLVLDDIADHRGFAAGMAEVLESRGRLVLSLNNPYSAVLRGKVASYFESGAVGTYAGLRSAGVDVPFHHRTLEEYIAAFGEAWLLLRRLFDVRRPGGDELPSDQRALRESFPWFMILELVKA